MKVAAACLPSTARRLDSSEYMHGPSSHSVVSSWTLFCASCRASDHRPSGDAISTPQSVLVLLHCDEQTFTYFDEALHASRHSRCDNRNALVEPRRLQEAAAIVFVTRWKKWRDSTDVSLGWCHVSTPVQRIGVNLGMISVLSMVHRLCERRWQRPSKRFHVRNNGCYNPGKSRSLPDTGFAHFGVAATTKEGVSSAHSRRL